MLGACVAPGKEQSLCCGMSWHQDLNSTSVFQSASQLKQVSYLLPS